jgi:hypothetical protein
MGHGADRTLIAGKFGIVSVNVDSLDDADECDEQDTKQRQSRYRRLFARFISRENQNQCPTLIPGTQPVSHRMHQLAGKLPDSKRSEPKEFAQAFGLGAADGNFGLLLVVQAQLIRALEPGNNFLDSVDIYQERPMGPPEHVRIQAI